MFSFIVSGFNNGALTPFLQNLGQMLGVLLCNKKGEDEALSDGPRFTELESSLLSKVYLL